MDHVPLLLFAQKGGPPPEAAWFVFLILCVEGLFALLGLAWAVFVYMSLYKAFSAVSPRNRDMEPGMIFLMLIPCFGIVWYFFVVLRLATSLEKEYADRGLRGDGDFGKMLGILVIIPCIGFICQIMWIMKIRGYTAVLMGGGGKRRSRDDDDDDDRPRKRRPRDEDNE